MPYSNSFSLVQPVETAANSFHLSCLEDAKNACTYCNTNRHKRKHFAKQTFQNCPCENQTLCLRKRRKVTLYSRNAGRSPLLRACGRKKARPRTGASSFAHEARIPPVRCAPTAAKENSRRRSGAHPISTDNKKKKISRRRAFALLVTIL